MADYYSYSIEDFKGMGRGIRRYVNQSVINPIVNSN
jgi:hypothetical protein